MMSTVHRRRRQRRLSAAGVGIFGLLAGVGTTGLTSISSEYLLVAAEVEKPEEIAFEINLEEDLAPEKEELELEPPEPEPVQLAKAKPEVLVKLEPLPPEPEPEPEPEEEEEPEEEPVEQPPPPELLPDHMKMAEQLEEFDEKEVPEDYEFLSNINRAVLEQTRATITNLIEDAKEAKSEQIEPEEEPVPGDAAEDDVAQVEEQESRLARESPKARPEKEAMRPEQDDERPVSKLAMRELAPQSHEAAMIEREELARDADDGVVASQENASASLAPREQQAETQERDPRYAFTLSGHEMDAAFGKDIDAAKRMASLDRSKKKGVWDGVRDRYESPLENMIPEIRAGNTTALASRKHPFASYITAMHRGIHDLYAWGFLEGLPSRGANHPLNDNSLRTVVEIMLNGDGTINKLTTVHHSGSTVFDTAVKEVVHAAGPYPNPPNSIKSPDGYIYIHWAFNRNERACGTFQATPFIRSDSGGPGPNDSLAGEGGGVVETPEELSRLARRAGTAQRGNTGAGGGGHEGHNHGAQPVPEGPPRPGPAPRAGGRSLSGSPSPSGLSPRGAGGPRAPSAAGPRRVPAGPARVPGPAFGGASPATAGPALSGTGDDAASIDPKARAAADAWVLGLARDQVERMVARSSVPFSNRGEIVARSKEQLAQMFTAMADEAGAKREGPVKVYTAPGLRKRFGSVPAGVQDGEGRVFAVATVDGDTFVLVLERKFGGWRVIGMTR